MEDEELIREVVHAFLQDDGHTVTLAADGLEGLEAFKKGQFDLVVSDWAMPGLNGDQLAAATKKLRPEIPVIMVTGFGDIAEASQSEPSFVDAVLSKPVQPRQIREAIARVVGGQEE